MITKRALTTPQDFMLENQIITPFGFSKIFSNTRTGVFYNAIFDATARFADSNKLKGIPLTENLLKRIRKQYLHDHSSVEFSVTPPGERQIENNYWSSEFDLSRLHLSPSFSIQYPEGIGEGKPRIKPEVPDFWFSWLTAYGTGSGKFLGVSDIRNFQLRYLHQIQNLYYWLSGYKIFVRDEILRDEFLHLLTIES